MNLKLDNVILITGKVKFRINLDPSVWLFDDRRFPLDSKIEGTKGTAITLKPFIDNAEPSPSVTQLICHRRDHAPVSIPIHQVDQCYLCFAIDHQPLPAGGPVWLYFADGRNKDQPIDHITEFELT